MPSVGFVERFVITRQMAERTIAVFLAKSVTATKCDTAYFGD